LFDNVNVESEFITEEAARRVTFELEPRVAQNFLTNIPLTLLKRALQELKGQEYLNEDLFYRDASALIEGFDRELYIDGTMRVDAYINSDGLLFYSRWAYNNIVEEFYLEPAGLHDLSEIDTKPWWPCEQIETYVVDKNRQYTLLALPRVYFDYPKYDRPAIDLDNPRSMPENLTEEKQEE
jgi:hypothetical protein